MSAIVKNKNNKINIKVWPMSAIVKNTNNKKKMSMAYECHSKKKKH